MIMYRNRCYVPQTVHDHEVASDVGGVDDDAGAVAAEEVAGEFERLTGTGVGGSFYLHQRGALGDVQRLGLAHPGGHRLQALPGPVPPPPAPRLEPPLPGALPPELPPAGGPGG